MRESEREYAARWDGMDSGERFELLRRTYPNAADEVLSKFSLKTWKQLPGLMARVLRGFAEQVDRARGGL